MNLNRLHDILLEGISNNETVGGNLLCLQNGKEIFYTEAGSRCMETGEPIRRDTIFRLYSMTKPVTSGAVMLLIEQGKIDLLDPVHKYLPGFQNQKVWRGGKAEPLASPMCIKDLLNMTSGLTYPGINTEAERDCCKIFERLDAELAEKQDAELTEKQDAGLAERLDAELAGNADTGLVENAGSLPEHRKKRYGTVEAMNELGTYPLACAPGEAWNYSASADVLGAIVEVASGMSFGEFLQRNLFEPLEMKDTAFYVPQEKQSRLAYAYEWTGKEWILYTGTNLAIQSRMEREPAFESGGAGLCSTIDDYEHYATMLLQNGCYHGKQILSKKTVEYMTTCQITPEQARTMNWDGLRGYSYGNLLRILTKPQECAHLGTRGEYGWDGWLGCYFMNVPEDKLTFLLMMQKRDCGTSNLTRRLVNALYAGLE